MLATRPCTLVAGCTAGLWHKGLCCLPPAALEVDEGAPRRSAREKRAKPDLATPGKCLPSECMPSESPPAESSRPQSDGRSPLESFPAAIEQFAPPAPVLITSLSMPVAMGRPLPPYWPTLSDLPIATLVSPLEHLPVATSAAVAAAAAAEEESWRRLVAPMPGQSSASALRTPTKKCGKGRAALQRLQQRVQDREAANEVGTLCKCGKLDEDKYMLQCDGCDTWFHGECVGLTQAQCTRARSWRCRACAKRHVAEVSRSTVYCHCRGPWDGRSFMIQCDACECWYHGACVGYSIRTAQHCTEAAFRRYHCPTCTATAAAPEVPVLPPALSSKAAGKRKAAPAASAAVDHATPSHAGDLPDLARFVVSAGSSSTHVSSGRPAAAEAACRAAVCIDDVSVIDGGSDVDDGDDVGTADSAPPAETRCLLLTRLDDDALATILEMLGGSAKATEPQRAELRLRCLLLGVAPTCRRLASLAEPTFQTFCTLQRWRPPRRTRDCPFAWRLLLRQRACAVCLVADAHFPVRRQGGGLSGGCPLLFRLCRKCAKRDKVQQQVQWHGLEVDAIDEHGKALFARQFHMPLFGHANGFSTNLEVKVNRSGL